MYNGPLMSLLELETPILDFGVTLTTEGNLRELNTARTYQTKPVSIHIKINNKDRGLF